MTTLDFKLIPWQQEVISHPARFKVVVAGRRCGKSRLAAVNMIIEGLKCPRGSAVLYCSPTMGQSRQIIWDLLLDIGRDVIDSAHVNNLDITLVNGAKIYVRGADRPDTLRGVSLTYAVLDEFGSMKAFVFEQIIRAALADKGGKALFIGTPSGRNHFYDTYQMAISGSDPEWMGWHFTTEHNPLIPASEIEAARRTMSSFSFKQEFMASFDNAGTDTFKEEWIKVGSEPKNGSYYMACDLAGFEDVGVANTVRKKRLDNSAFAIVKVTDEGKWFVKKIEYGRWDVRETAVRILKNVREFKPLMVGIEKGTTMNAVVPYLTDLMRKNNIFFHIHPLSHMNQKKNDRIIWALQGMFEHGRVILNEEGKNDRNSWQSVFLDEYLMFPTRDVHDDLLDALAYISQMAVTTYNGDDMDDEMEVLDVIVGF